MLKVQCLSESHGGVVLISLMWLLPKWLSSSELVSESGYYPKGATIEGCYYPKGATIEGCYYPRGATIKVCYYPRVTIIQGELLLEGATTIKWEFLNVFYEIFKITIKPSKIRTPMANLSLQVTLCAVI